MSIKIECVAATRSRIGEGPVWDVADQRLWWVDIPAGLIYCFDPETKENLSFDFGEPVGCLARREKGGLVVAAKSGFWFFDPHSGTKEFIADPESNLPDNRFNDGGTDSQGRFWAGTMKEGGEPQALGTFYRLNTDLSVLPWRSNFWTTNGLCFSPEGTRLYFSDSNARVRTIWSCDYDPTTGTPGEPHLFFDTHNIQGRPDGGTVDAEGCYWQAGIEGWALYRISPEGKLLQTIEVPVEKPTKPMFGGKNLDTLFFTSLSQGLTDPERQPEAGSLFAITGLGVKGIPQTRFAG